jgi:6-phosphogluconolactonase
MVYKFDGANGTIVPNDPPAVAVPPGSGPRHFAFHPSGKCAYACGEMTSTVIAFAYDADKGALKVQQVLSTLPQETKGNSTAEILVSPDGRHVYVSNRGHNSVAVFAVDESTGKLKAAGHCPTGGKTPRNFGIDPSGKWLIAANQDSNNVVVFKIDATNGMPSPAGHEVQVSKAVCVKFLVK